MNCSSINWSPSTADQLAPTIIVCSIAVSVHVIFWVQLIPFPSLRQRNLMWLYGYLMTDFFLLVRFFVLYILRHERVCLYLTLRRVLCYFEASSKFYINVVQSYILLALAACRCAQIIFNRNVYVKDTGFIVLSLIMIFTLPALNVVVQFFVNWTVLWRRAGEACDLSYVSVPAQVFNLFVTYLIPVISNLIIIGFCIRHVSLVTNVRSQQIINLRRRYKKTLLIQTIFFYSIWVVLWSPNLLAFQFINMNTQAGIYTSLLNYIEIALDPVIVAALDVRFLQAWRQVWHKIKENRRRVVAPTLPTLAEQKQ